MIQEKGSISVNTENIFPIIKKFLYSDHEIFLRELVSNAVDASQKLKKLASIGEFTGELGELKVSVNFDADAKTITISDNGIGMTAEEVKKYINQVAFSGASDFLEKYKGKTERSEIIGHFGLGFYSAFMVASRVEIVTLSFRENSQAVRWSCDGSTSFELTEGSRSERGTDVVLFLSDDSFEFAEKHRLRQILKKYCSFLPITIDFAGEIINETQPIWTKNPTDLSEQDYLDFYKKLYPSALEPIFHIHLNVDYPFNLTGVLYFPKVYQNDIGTIKDKIQLYSRQVFITDEVKDVVPEFLLLLQGVIDSPDIPLNVSRSYLQADANVKKINSYITRKVSDKLAELFKEDRSKFEEKWEGMGVFVKYGMITDEKFYDKAQKFCLLKNVDGKYFTIEELLERLGEEQTDKNGNKVLIYTTDKEKQHSFIRSAQKRNYEIVSFEGLVDNHFIGTLERKLEKVSMKRVDSEVVDNLVEKEIKLESVLSQTETDKVLEIFKKAVNDEKMEVKVEALPIDELPVTITIPEYMRRMQEMAKMQGMSHFLNELHTITINANHNLVNKILQISDEQAQTDLAKQAYDLALLSQNLLIGKDLTSFIERSVQMLSKN